MNLQEIKQLIEDNPVALGTVTDGNKPNIIGVAFVKVVSDSEILITDNYMNRTKNDILTNNDVCLIVWDKDFRGYKILGTAQYFSEGEWLDRVKEMSENEGLPAKGAVLVKVEKIIPSA